MAIKNEERNIIIGALRACTERAAIEKVFDKFCKENNFKLEDKTDLLIEAMGSPQTFFSTGNPTVEQKYELVIEMFLSMTWKFSLLCKGKRA